MHYRPPIIFRPKILSPKFQRQPSLSPFSSSSWSHGTPLILPAATRSLILRSSSTSRKTKSCRTRTRAAYVSAPASDPDSIDAIARPEARVFLVDSAAKAVSWGVLWRLISQHKLRIVASVAALVGGTSCTLAMPIFSGMLTTAW